MYNHQAGAGFAAGTGVAAVGVVVDEEEAYAQRRRAVHVVEAQHRRTCVQLACHTIDGNMLTQKMCGSRCPQHLHIPWQTRCLSSTGLGELSPNLPLLM